MKTLNNLLKNLSVFLTVAVCGFALSSTSSANTGGPAYLQFNSSSYTVAANATNATVTVTRTSNLDEPTSVNYETSDSTAIAGSDYVAATGTLIFNPGETSKTFSVEIIPQNSGSDKALKLQLCCATYSGFITRGTASLTISAAAAPRLQLAVVGGNTLRVSWPANAGNYVLEATDNYATEDWQTVAQTPTVVNNQNTVDFSTSAPVKLFRLRQI